jgi:hypothetical protein
MRDSEVTADQKGPTELCSPHVFLGSHCCKEYRFDV